MNDYQETLKESADFLRGFVESGSKSITVYRGREAMRPVRINEDNTVEVLVGRSWRSAYVSPGGIRKIIVR